MRNIKKYKAFGSGRIIKTIPKKIALEIEDIFFELIDDKSIFLKKAYYDNEDGWLQAESFFNLSPIGIHTISIGVITTSNKVLQGEHVVTPRFPIRKISKDSLIEVIECIKRSVDCFGSIDAENTKYNIEYELISNSGNYSTIHKERSINFRDIDDLLNKDIYSIYISFYITDTSI